jgi:hypothetical protein
MPSFDVGCSEGVRKSWLRGPEPSFRRGFAETVKTRSCFVVHAILRHGFPGGWVIGFRFSPGRLPAESLRGSFEHTFSLRKLFTPWCQHHVVSTRGRPPRAPCVNSKFMFKQKQHLFKILQNCPKVVSELVHLVYAVMLFLKSSIRSQLCSTSPGNCFFPTYFTRLQTFAWRLHLPASFSQQCSDLFIIFQTCSEMLEGFLRENKMHNIVQQSSSLSNLHKIVQKLF